ncbi:MAG: sigma-54-dependent Fis family transcriptional regulator, partial [Rhodobacteraceae bacterium]|nr:sigma-54-dependent Fis family transcriptional regulator [Paracoccaceae bacterium]
PMVQARLLTLLSEEGQGLPPEVRVIAICNAAESERRCEEVLRSDLYFRLAAMRLYLPPLRARGEDILTLFNRFAEQFAEEYGCPAPDVTASEASQLLQHPWPGNVRQLINMAERAVLQSRRGTNGLAALLSPDPEAPPIALGSHGKPLKDYVEAFERMLIDTTMRRHRGSVSAVMEELGLPRRTLNEKMAKYGLSRSDYL